MDPQTKCFSFVKYVRKKGQACVIGLPVSVMLFC